MATQGQFVHGPGAFIPVRERWLTGVNESSREGAGGRGRGQEQLVSRSSGGAE